VAYTSNSCISQSPIHSSSNQHKQKKLIHEKKCIHEKKRVFKSAIKQMCLVRSIDIHPTLREAWYEEVSVTSLLCSAGILGHHLLQPHCRNKEWAVQYTSKIKAIHSLLIGEMFVRWASVWSEVQILQICWTWWGHKIFVFLLQRTLWFLIQKMEFLFCCAVLWWIRASWRYLHIWPDRSSRISSTFSAR